MYNAESIANNLDGVGIDFDLRHISSLKDKLFEAMANKVNDALQLLEALHKSTMNSEVNAKLDKVLEIYI